MGPGTISDLYHDEILAPSVPLVAPTLTDPIKQKAIIDAFSLLKQTALQEWDKMKAASIQIGKAETSYHPSEPTPSSWWDKTDAEIWTQQTISIKAAAVPPQEDMDPADIILQVKAEEAALDQKAAAGMPIAMIPEEAPAFRWSKAGEAWNKQTIRSDVTVTFEFCNVGISRPWLNMAFLTSKLWCLPGQTKGALSTDDGQGLPSLPVGFVALKNLRITANWTDKDVANLERSSQFGPFNFDSRVVDGTISHSGIQIIGWFMEDVPELPPNSG